jgi:hypothetical protein
MTRTWIHIAAVAVCSLPLVSQVRAFGLGCNGHLNAQPTMAASAPMVAGTKFNLEIETIAKNASAMLVFGVSNQTWSGVPLPFDLGFVGINGCFLNVSFDKVTTLTSDANGKISIPIDATNLPGGLRLYSQVVVPEPSGTRVATSPGYELDLQKSEKPFTLVLLPDTQHYVISTIWNRHFLAMTQWIVTNIAAKNSVFVSHIGDIVVNGAIGTNKNKDQWDRAEASIVKLDGNLTTKPDGVIPYDLCVGNRDYDIIHVKGAATQYLKYFGHARYSARTWWGGSGPDGLNSFQIFQANGRKFLNLSLEWRPRDKVITWARGVLTAHPGLPTILSTHQYLTTFGGTGLDNSGTTPNGTGDNGGADVRNKLVEPFPQIFLVLCGHNTGGTHRTQRSILGQNVHEVLADYSFDPEGGNGWMNLLQCQPDKAMLVNSAFSPTYKPGSSPGPDRRRNASNNSTFRIDFHAHRRRLETVSMLRFIGDHDIGHGKYTGAMDTFISSSAASSSFGTTTDIQVNDPTGTDEQQGLLMFGSIFGTGAGKVPKNRRIVQAILTLTTEGAGAKSAAVNRLYQLKVPFTESSTWSSLTGGIQVGTDTVTAPVISTGTNISTEGTRSFDVTASLRAWQSGDKNYGWAVLNTGTDAWSFRSQNWPAPAERPMLTVIFEK